MIENYIFVPGNIPSSKNSKVATGKGMFHSPSVRKWLQFIGVKSFSSGKKSYENYKTRPNKFEALTESFLELKKDTGKPIFIGFHFVRDSRRKYDFHNAVQILFDLMTAHGWIEDDDTTEVYGVPFRLRGEWQTIDKENAGCYICVLEDYEND